MTEWMQIDAAASRWERRRFRLCDTRGALKRHRLSPVVDVAHTSRGLMTRFILHERSFSGDHARDRQRRR